MTRPSRAETTSIAVILPWVPILSVKTRKESPEVKRLKLILPEKLCLMVAISDLVRPMRLAALSKVSPFLIMPKTRRGRVLRFSAVCCSKIFSCSRANCASWALRACSWALALARISSCFLRSAAASWAKGISSAWANLAMSLGSSKCSLIFS